MKIGIVLVWNNWVNVMVLINLVMIQLEDYHRLGIKTRTVMVMVVGILKQKDVQPIIVIQVIHQLVLIGEDMVKLMTYNILNTRKILVSVQNQVYQILIVQLLVITKAFVYRLQIIRKKH